MRPGAIQVTKVGTKVGAHSHLVVHRPPRCISPRRIHRISPPTQHSVFSVRCADRVDGACDKRNVVRFHPRHAHAAIARQVHVEVGAHRVDLRRG